MADFEEETELPKKRQKLDANDAEECVQVEEMVADKVGERENANESDEKLKLLNETTGNSSSCKEPRVVAKLSSETLSSSSKSAKTNERESDNHQVHRTEQEVGILEYVSCHEGFSGTLKQRYSDFIVNERDLEGRTVHLTNTALPAEFIREKLENAVISVEALQKLEDLVKSDDKTVKIVVKIEDDKEKRTLVHREIREKFPNLESDTVEENNHKAVRAFHHVPNEKMKWRKFDWPKERGEFCHFSLYKENKDTMQAINLLSKFIKVKPDRFAYAGTKDGRAVTVQRVSVFRIDAKNLQGLNKVLNNICLGNFEFKKRPLKLGDLMGNMFVIVLRNVKGDDEQIKAAMTSMKESGFINYYGLQRFGSSRSATHCVGLCLLKSEWTEAVNLIIGSKCDGDSVLSKACQHWQATKDAKEALEMFKGKKCVESFLLEGLSKFGSKDTVSALKYIPRNTRLMYVHAYQSYLWNKVVSRRIKEFGLQPVVGDLVLKEKSATSTSKFGNSDDKASQSEGTIELPVKALTEEDIQSGCYSIHDVVLPLPGYDVEYPKHSAKDWYENLLSADGLDINNMRHKVKDYSLSGAYRRMTVLPNHLEWKMFRYNDPTIPLVLTDLGRLRGDAEPESVVDGKYKAVRIELGLPSSSYATMAVREILKTDTSPSFHSSLNEH